MDVYDQPVALNGKLYVRGTGSSSVTVLEYTPDKDQWAELPPLPINYFTIATLKGQLLVVGGKHTGPPRKKSSTIFTFDERYRKWTQTYPGMPSALTHPAVIGYHDYLVIAGGWNTQGAILPDVSILDTATNSWRTAEPLPYTTVGYSRDLDQYHSVLLGDSVYLVGQDTQAVLRAHLPTLVSGASPVTIWESFLPSLYCHSSPIAIGNTLLTVGGSDRSHPIASIQCYDLTTNKWKRVGDLPEPMRDSYCAVLSRELFVLGGFGNKSVFTSKICY